MEWYIESQVLLCQSQLGFRKGKSTLDNLTILFNEISSTFIKRGITTAMFIDVKGAYDNVDIDILSYQLKKIKIPNNF